MMESSAGRGIKKYIYLHALLMIYSLGAICSKLASQKEFMSVGFFFFYGLVLVDLFIYALGWQQILKMFPLTVAFANKAVVIAWGMLWGAILFGEVITWNMVLGAIIIALGIGLVVKNDE